MKYILIGTIIGYVGGATNYFLWYDIPIPPIGNIAASFYIAVTTYAIVRHRFLDIEVIIKRTLVFAGLFGMVMAVVAVVSGIVNGFLARFISVSSNGVAIGSALLVMLAFDPVRRLLVLMTDKYLFQKKEDISGVLQKLSEEVTTIFDLLEVGAKVLGTLEKMIRPESGLILLKNGETGKYQTLDSFGLAQNKFIYEDQNPLIQSFKTNKRVLNFEDSEQREGLSLATIHELTALKAVVAIPLVAQNTFLGLLVLGKKKSDQIYDREELESFPVMASQTALALRNALLVNALVEEKEAKVKAQHLAERVKFAKTIKHEVKNALAGIEGPARFLSMYYTADLKKAFKENDGEWFGEICDKMDKQVSQKIFKGVEKVFDIAETSLGGLDKEDRSSRRIYFKILWDEAKEESGIPGNFNFESSIPDGFVIYGNYHVLQRVLVNLITNACDAMKDQEKKLIKLRCSYQNFEDKPAAYFEFEDEGPGIPAEIQKQIFEQGFSTKPKPGHGDLLASGHGQGLYVCKMNIEKLHGGKMRVESEMGKGTVFKFWIPVKEPS